MARVLRRFQAPVPARKHGGGGGGGEVRSEEYSRPSGRMGASFSFLRKGGGSMSHGW